MPVEALGFAASQHAQSVLNLGYAFLSKHKNKQKPHPPPLIFPHTLYILPCLVILSLVWFGITWAAPQLYAKARAYATRRQPIFLGDDDDEIEADVEEVIEPVEAPPVMPSEGLWADLRAHWRSLRSHGTVIVLLDILRSLLVAALLGLSIYAAILADGPPPDDRNTSGPPSSGMMEELRKKKKKKKNKSTVDEFSSLEWGEMGACCFYLYVLLLSLMVLALQRTKLRRNLTNHIDMLLAVAFGIFAYRDIWPELTYYLSPSDLNNWVTWTRIGLLFLAGVVTPLVRPRTYVPADPMEPTPSELVHPEQTASPFNFIFYNFMTDLIRKAWKTTSLPYDDLHPLADYDRASHLYTKHIHKVDPMRRKENGWRKAHLFWNLLYTFRREFFWAGVMCALTAFWEITPTIALNRLLMYIQTDGKGAKIKPWVWIAMLFLGPTLNSMSIQYYVFIMTRCLVRAEALLTQLLFDHALRLRMKDTVEAEDKQPDADVPDILVEEAEQNGHSNGAANGTANGKDKKKSKAEDAAAAAKAPTQGIIGRINVLMSQDIESLVEGRDILLFLVYTPTSLFLCMYILFKLLSWSALVGVAALLLTLPVPGWITKLSATVQSKKMEATDARVDTITEAIGALRIIKMFGWEDRIKARISAKREDELVLTWQRRLLNLINNIANLILPVVTMTVSLASYTLIQRRPLDAATVFTSMGIFEMLKDNFGMTFWMVNQYITSGVSLSRINKFLNETDMIDAFSPGAQLDFQQTPEHLAAIDDGLIRLKDATFAWGKDSGDKNMINYRIHVPDVTFRKGEVNLITGPTGSGKSSLLKALIGELHFEAQPGSFFHLPRQGGVSYAAQESWCLSATIRDNILFGSPYDEARYRKVIHDCALEPDIRMFDDGDQTEIGEKGVTLSGGQKARITLARAIYARTSTVLLDDIFSALDTLTSRFILDNLFRGDLIEGRTVVLITHHVHLAAPVASYMVTLNENGQVTHAGPIDSTCVSSSSSSEDMVAKCEELEDVLEKVKPSSEESGGKIGGTDAASPANKLIKDEEKSEGRISRKALFSFFSTFGGPTFWIMFWGLLFASQVLAALQPYWLGLWARAYRASSTPTNVDPVFWLGWYMIWVILGTFSVALATVLYYQGSMRASRVVHSRLVDKIFGAPLRFLDTTPVGRIISRFTKDMKQIDGNFTETAIGVFTMTMGMVIKFIAVVALVPMFSVPAIAIGLIGAFIGELYIHGQLSVKREMSNAKSPLFSHLSASINGIVSIRAYGAQEQIKRETQAKADKYTRAATAFYNLNRWVTIRIDMLGGVFSALLASFLIYFSDLDPSDAGFALQQAISFSVMILWWVRMVNEMEVQGNSVERIEDYMVIDQEPASVAERTPPAAWPTSGEVILQDLSAKYSEDGPEVLHGLNVHIKSGERIGIVGRTGSGKSTLTVALLRMIPTSGEVYIDGVRTDTINLHDLRSHVTIIPQDPVLLSGSLRFNLDPFGEHPDSVLRDAMESSGLGQTASYDDLPPGTSTPQRITLDTLVTAGGSNLSQGQRQLVALARALVRQSKVLILDEATASVDFAGDQIIQKSIRALPPGTTVLTVAHRLATVMDYDRILVLDKGRVVEFDSPEALKNREGSYFASLVAAMEG